MKGVQHRLEFLTRRLSVNEWRLLGAIAMERELGLTPIARLAHTFGVVAVARAAAAGRPLPNERLRTASAAPRVSRGGGAGAGSALAGLGELEAWLESGLLMEVGFAKASSLTRTGVSEPAYAVDAEFRQLVVRRLAAKGELAAVAEATHGLLGDRSLGVFALLLQAGRLAEFQRYAYSLPRASGRLGEELSGEDLLREAITRPFDAVWFKAVWQDQALAAAQRVLREALPELDECDALFNWLGGEVAAAAGSLPVELASERAAGAGVNEASLRQVLGEHAVLRGRPEMADVHAAELPGAPGLALQAATHYQSGDLAGAQRLLDERLQSRSPLPDAGSLAPLFALLVYSRGTAAATLEAKRMLSPRTAEQNLTGVDRAFRTLLRYGSQPETEHARLDVHQLARDATSWELLILGLTVHLHLKQEVTHLRNTQRQKIRATITW